MLYLPHRNTFTPVSIKLNFISIGILVDFFNLPIKSYVDYITQTFKVMDAFDVAEQIRDALPGTEEIIVQYLAGYLVDDAGDDEDSLQVTRQILESAVPDGEQQPIDKLLSDLGNLLDEHLKRRSQARGPTLRKLGNVMDMSKVGAMSATITFAEGVDLSSINKGKCVS